MANTPILTTTPGSPPTYNPAIADTFSWIPVQGAGRTLYARATYIANPDDISISLSANNINVNLSDVEDLIRALNVLNSGISSTNYSSSLQLGSLTGVDFATATKQDITNAFLEHLTAVDTTGNILLTFLTGNQLFIATQLSVLTAVQQFQTLQLSTLTSVDYATSNNQQILLTKIDALTSVDYATSNNQQILLTKIDALTSVDYATAANQVLASTQLNAITAKQDITNTLLDSLTSKQYSVFLEASAISINVDEVETKLDALTGKDFATSSNQLINNTLLSLTINRLDSLTAFNTSTVPYQQFVQSELTGLNVLLNDLTGNNFATTGNQDKTNLLLDALTGLSFYGVTSSSPVFVNQGNLNYTTDSVTVTSNSPLYALQGDLNYTTDSVTVTSNSPLYVIQGDLNYNTDSVAVSVLNFAQMFKTVEDLLNIQLGQSGFVFVEPTSIYEGNFTTIQVVSACQVQGLTATNSIVNGLSSYELPVGFSFNGPIKGISLKYGSAIAYKL